MISDNFIFNSTFSKPSVDYEQLTSLFEDYHSNAKNTRFFIGFL